MGRTSKFTFPVPGRRVKLEPPVPMSSGTSGPITKAQKILGTPDINTGTPPRTWDANSISGISVTLSENTCSYSDATLGLLDDTDEEEDQLPELRRGGMGAGSKEWDQESEVIPNRLQQGDESGVDMSDVSSVRRKRMSTSTITSFYDKSKMPLSISQQTSSSAIAKGPPSLQQPPSPVDEETTMVRKKKKRPARLDLSYLLLRSRSRSSKNLVLGPDMVTKSPSLMSFSSDAAGPLARHTRAERRLTKRATSESLEGKSIAEEPTGNGRPRGTNDTRGLHNLYDHYEQMTFRSIMGDGIEELDSLASAEDGQQDEQSRKSSRESVPFIARHPHTESLLDPARDLTVGMVGGDCSASVSSKYTRTSKASKRTNQSMAESDLNEKSVLSLSDDSDDERTASALVEANAPLSPGRTDAPTESRRLTTQSPHSVSGRRRVSSSVPFVRSARAASHHFFSPPSSTPPTSSLPEIPKNATRRASAMPAVAIWPKRSSSRTSAKTSSSRDSTRMRRSKTAQDSPVSDVHIQRPSTTLVDHSAQLATPAKSHRKSARPTLQTTNTRSSVLPHQLPQFNTAHSPSPRQIYHQTSHQRSTSDQPTPPLSPDSVGSGKRPESVDGEASSRFMAVTKQEEMLLSALRNKRKHMRETILAEFEGCGRSSVPSSSRHGRNISNASSSGSLDSPISPTSRRRMSLNGFNSSSPVAMSAPIEVFRHQRRSSLAGPPSHLTFATTAASDPTTVGPVTPGAGNKNPLYKQEYYFPTFTPAPGKTSNNNTKTETGTSYPFAPYKGQYSISTPQHLSFISPVRSASGNLQAECHERVFLYLDRPMEEGEHEPTAEDITCGYDSEPSPDLSDFIDFDEMSADPITPVTVSGKRASQGSEQVSPKATLPAGRMVQPHGQPIAEEEPIPDFEEHESNKMALGIPRPDSPISPAGFLAPPPATHQARQNAVRISAVGPAGGGAPTAWWADE